MMGKYYCLYFIEVFIEFPGTYSGNYISLPVIIYHYRWLSYFEKYKFIPIPNCNYDGRAEKI